MKFFSLIYQGEIRMTTDEKVLPAEDFSTLMSVYEILEKAKEDIALYKKETEKECARLRREAEEAGFAEGLEKFNTHLLQFEQEVRGLRLEMQQQLLPLALKAAKKIVAKELELYPETIIDIVLQALAPLTQNRRFTIYVNKADKEILEANKPKIKEILEHVESLAIAERGDISPGGCIIETEAGIINATIENQWRALETAFSKYMQH